MGHQEIEHNPARYRRLCEPFDDHVEANAAIKKFFDGVSALREECGIPDVFIALEVVAGPEERRGDASLYLGDFTHKIAMIARMYGAARAEHEEIMGLAIESGRESYRAKR